MRTYLLDVTDVVQVTAVTQDAIRDFGIIHVIVNNAGFAQYGSLETSSLEQIRAQFETNDFGLIAVSQAFIPHLRDHAGTIINLASLTAKIGFPIFSVYSSSKAAVAVLSEALAVDAPFDGKVKAIFPGTHATQISTKWMRVWRANTKMTCRTSSIFWRRNAVCRKSRLLKTSLE